MEKEGSQKAVPELDLQHQGKVTPSLSHGGDQDRGNGGSLVGRGFSGNTIHHLSLHKEQGPQKPLGLG